MKLQEIRPVRSICLESIFKRHNPKSRTGLSPFRSKLKEITGENRHDPRRIDYNVLTGKFEQVINKRVTFARTKSKNRFHAVGIGEFSGTFSEFKDAMKAAGFTAYRMFGKENSLVS